MAQLEALPDQVRRTFRRRATPPMTIGRLRTTPRVMIEGMKVMRSVLSPPARVRLVVRQLHMGSALVAYATIHAVAPEPLPIRIRRTGSTNGSVCHRCEAKRPEG